MSSLSSPPPAPRTARRARSTPWSFLLEMTPPGSGSAGPGATENMLATLALADGCALELVSDRQGVRLLARAPTAAARAHLARQLHAQYPQCALRMVDDRAADPTRIAAGDAASARELRLREPAYLPVRTYDDRDAKDGNDPLLGVLGALGDLPEGLRGVCQVALWPADPRWARELGQFLSPRAAQVERMKAREASGGGESALPLLLAGLLGAAGWKGYLLYTAGDLLHAGLLGAGVLAVLGLALLMALRLGRAAVPDPALVREKAAHRGFVARVRLLVVSSAATPAARAARQAALARLEAAYGPYHLPGGNAFVSRSCRPDGLTRPQPHAGLPWPGRRPLPILTASELAGLWHPPAPERTVPGLRRTGARQLVPAHPALLGVTDRGEPGIVLGVSRGQGKEMEVFLPAGHLRRNTLVLGSSGSGKTTYLLHVARGVLSDPRVGLVVLDPHSSAAPRILRLMPPQRAREAIAVSFADTDNPLGLNLLDVCTGRSCAQIEESLIAAFKYHWDGSWGARMENVFRYALRTLLEANLTRPRAAQYTILEVNPLLTNGPFRMDVLRQVRDRDLQRYWLSDYANLPRNFRAEMIMPVQNKIDRFNQPILRAIVGQSETRLSLDPLLQQGAPLIVDTAAALIGVDNAGLLGATLLDLLACRLRERGEGAQRIVVLVDEFQQTPVNWAIYVEGLRKYGASFVLATQSLASLERVQPGLRSSIFANKGTVVCFQSSAEDARYLTYEMDEAVESRDLLNLPVRHAYLKTTTGEDRLPVCSVEVPLLPDGDAGIARRILEASALRYGRDRAEVEAERQAFLDQIYTRPAKTEGKAEETEGGKVASPAAERTPPAGLATPPPPRDGAATTEPPDEEGGKRVRTRNPQRSDDQPAPQGAA